MQVTINQITPRKENNEVTSVQVHFTARTPDGSINLSGNIPVAEFTNLIDFSGMESAVRQELINRIMNGESPTE